MKFLSMSLALFLGAALAATTDAAPAGLKKGGESASLHRFLEDIETAELMCKILETFDNLGRKQNARDGFPGLDWSPLCDDFQPLDEFLCPTEDAVAAICSAKNPDKNPAVQNNWCLPFFAFIDGDERRGDCIKFCTNYVSTARGGCCDIDCFAEISNDGSYEFFP
jgi:hypothetical protein